MCIAYSSKLNSVTSDTLRCIDIESLSKSVSAVLTVSSQISLYNVITVTECAYIHFRAHSTYKHHEIFHFMMSLPTMSFGEWDRGRWVGA